MRRFGQEGSCAQQEARPQGAHRAVEPGCSGHRLCELDASRFMVRSAPHTCDSWRGGQLWAGFLGHRRQTGVDDQHRAAAVQMNRLQRRDLLGKPWTGAQRSGPLLCTAKKFLEHRGAVGAWDTREMPASPLHQCRQRDSDRPQPAAEQGGSQAVYPTEEVPPGGS